MKKTEAWNSILSIYGRLSAAYDNYYDFLGFLSQRMRTLLQQYKSYAEIYSATATPEYYDAYANTTPNDFAKSYNHADYTDAYESLTLKGAVNFE